MPVDLTRLFRLIPHRVIRHYRLTERLLDPDDLAEGEAILDQLLRNAIEDWEAEQRQAGLPY